MRLFLLISLSFAFLSCEEKVQEQAVADNDEMEFSRELEVTTNRKVNLLPDARQQVSEWLAYVAAQDEIESLRSHTGTEIVATSNSLMQIMENLKATLPDTLQTPAVRSRANVLLTKAKILDQLASKKDKEAKEIFDVANDLIVEFDNFKLQLNELFLKTPDDFELELDREFEEAQADTSAAFGEQ